MKQTYKLRSREKREYHIAITANFPDKESATNFKKIMRQAIHKQNRSPHKSSYEMELQFNCDTT